MSSLLTSLVRLRRDPRLFKIPPYLSLLCILVGVVSLLVLPLDSHSRRTYISENALLPGQVHTYFGGSDQNVFRAYKHEVNSLLGHYDDNDGHEIAPAATNTQINDHLASILESVGLKIGRQNYTYRSAGDTIAGENLYAILQAPRGDATEALVLVAPWLSMHGVPNTHGVALALALARYFRRWSLWSKDIVFLFPPDSLAGPQAWVDAYHDAHDGRFVSPLPRKSGALQGAIAIDYTLAEAPKPLAEDGSGSSRFTSVHIVYDGVNGQLPNLDLINSVVSIAGGQMSTGVSLQEMWRHDDGYTDRLRTMLRGMLRQGVGAATGAHSAFMAYHVDAVTLQPYMATTLTPDGQFVISGWVHDEMAMGRILEGTYRSLNNLLEHLHQSFFFYLLMSRERFVSIGTYLPSAMLVAANFTIMAIALWVRSGQPSARDEQPAEKGAEKGSEKTVVAAERDLFLPLGVVALCQALGVAPLYLFNHVPAWALAPVFVVFAVVNAALPHALSRVLTVVYRPSAQQYDLIKSFSLLLLGMFLSSLATLNFSLAFLVGLLASPLTFTFYSSPSSAGKRWLGTLLLNLVSPPAVLVASCVAWKLDLAEALRLAAFGWDVWGMYTSIVVWCVWWPAWLAGSMLVLGQPL